MPLRLITIALNCTLSVLVIGVSCASNQELDNPQGLPDLVELERRIPAAVSTFDRRGIDTALRSPGATQQDESLLLAAGQGGLEWAIYQFSVTDYFHSETIEVSLDATATGQIWIAIAEWGQRQWLLHGPFDGPTTLDLQLEGAIMSPLDRFYIAVVCPEGQVAKIDGLVLSGNHDPWAEFLASPQVGQPGEAVELDAASSWDSDGEIVSYEWDLDDDGLFEIYNGSTPTENTWLPFPEGAVDITLRVTDDDGAVGLKVLTLIGQVSGPGVPLLIANEAQLVCGLEVVNDNPAVLYESPNGIEFIRAENALGSSWGSPVLITQDGYDVARLAIIGGKPAVVLPQSGEGVLYRAAQDANGEVWNSAVEAFDGAVGTYPRLAEINGSPAIAFATGNAGLFYLRALDSAGQTWAQPISVDSRHAYNSGAVSLAQVNGRPAIGYAIQEGNSLCFARAQDSEGTAWDTPLQVGPTDSNVYSALTVVAGKPGLVGHYANDEELYFVHAQDADGVAWSTRVPAVPNFTGSRSRMGFAVVAGLPTLLWHDSGPHRLEKCVANTVDGTSWDPLELVFELGTANNPAPAIVEVAGELGVAYRDWTDSADGLYFYRET